MVERVGGDPDEGPVKLDTHGCRLPPEITARLRRVLTNGESVSAFLRAAALVEIATRENAAEALKRRESINGIANWIAPARASRL